MQGVVGVIILKTKLRKQGQILLSRHQGKIVVVAFLFLLLLSVGIVTIMTPIFEEGSSKEDQSFPKPADKVKTSMRIQCSFSHCG